MAIEFKCSDVGLDCRWSVIASTDDIIMETISDHLASEHNMKEIPHALRDKIKNSINHTGFN
ncbi:MAG TPA: DUF1059 domain-containing protein [Nitrosopumilaceae archaeon]|nr:DUF1059 domain-containing protein [Nitrosopumilaceae archaeon]